MGKQQGTYTGGTMPFGPSVGAGSAPDASRSIWRQPVRKTNKPAPPPTPQQPAWPTSSWPPAKRSQPVNRRGALIGAIAIMVGALMIAGVAFLSRAPEMREPRGTIGPTVVVGQQVDYAGGDDAGLITVAEYRWLPATDYTPAGHEVLAVHLQAEVLNGPSYVPYDVRAITADGYRYTRTYVDTDLEMLRFDEYRRGAKVDGWVFFELPKQDVTLMYATWGEETLRLAIPGGPTVEMAEVGIPVDHTVQFDSYSGDCEATAHRALWTTNDQGASLLVVLLSIRSERGACHGTHPDLLDSDGNAIESGFGTVPEALVELPFDTVYAGDVMRGWVAYEVEERAVQLGFGYEPVTIPIPRAG